LSEAAVIAPSSVRSLGQRDLAKIALYIAADNPTCALPFAGESPGRLSLADVPERMILLFAEQKRYNKFSTRSF